MPEGGGACAAPVLGVERVQLLDRPVDADLGAHLARVRVGVGVRARVRARVKVLLQN